MNRHEQAWHRLAAAARTAPGEGEAAAPYGFATRMAALGLAAPAENPFRVLEKFAIRGLLAACAFSLAAVVFGYSTWSDHEEETIAANDSITELLGTS
jgi:hypothetical protein